MFGAILGDIIGSPYEFDSGNKSKDFPLFNDISEFTDDTVMTIAVADGLMRVGKEASDDEIKDSIIDAMHEWGDKFPNAGYGGNFGWWLYNHSREPYNSFGNGSAMRVSGAAWLADSLDEARRLARLSAEVTHNHPEGIKGAEAIASAIYLARQCCSKDAIREYIVEEFGYDLSRTCDEIRPEYFHIESCQQTVPEAITAFLEGADFEDVIRTAVSLGGDCDTLTAIAGSIAESFYGIPSELKLECYQRLDKELVKVLADFEERCHFTEEYFRMPIFWFETTKSGSVKLVKGNGKYMIFRSNDLLFEGTKEAAYGYMRAKLYVRARKIWDGTAFGAAMSCNLLYDDVRDLNGIHCKLVFTTPQNADHSVYKILSESQVAISKAYAEEFYSDRELQLGWQPMILYGVVVRVNDDGTLEPASLRDYDPGTIDFRKFDPCGFSDIFDDMMAEKLKH